jgi:hypothetical protein
MNELLRRHVTSVEFTLSLKKSHIRSLVYIDTMIRLSRDDPSYWIDQRFSVTGRRDTFVAGARGLEDRGLVTHHWPARRPGETHAPFHRCWKMTRAGRLVKSLLQETGQWQEFEKELPEPKRLETRSAS